MENKYITVSYRLYAMNGGEKELIEEAPAAHPFQFISGIGYTLDRFEKEITALEKGADFSFTIPCAEAYGERDEDNVRQVSKAMFCDPDGNFDSENIYPGNIIMLNDNEGHRFYANVGEITDDKVVIDLNHPHAGKDLMFEGKIIEMRPATNKEIEEIVLWRRMRTLSLIVFEFHHKLICHAGRSEASRMHTHDVHEILCRCSA